MSRRTFFTQLILITVLLVLVLLGLQMVPAFQHSNTLSWIGLAFFFVISIAMYFIGYKAALSDNKNTFTNVIMGFTMGKLILSITLILVFNKLAMPTGKLYILPFFLIYIVFTIFETMFMMKLGRMKT